MKSKDKHFFKCSVCGNGLFKTIYSTGLFSNKQTVSVCKNCGTVCLNPRWNERQYVEYYQAQYYGEYQPKILIDKEYNDKDNPRGVKIFNDLQDQEYLRRDAKIIEIGCGEGKNLIVFKKNGFNDLTGLELSVDCCRKLQKFYTIKCINKSLASYMPGFDASERFDCVILSHMLEHFVEPEKALGMISSVMKPEGVMYILVPDFYGFSKPKPYSQFTTPHTFYFSRTSLEMLLNNSGFIVDRYFESSADEIALVAKKKSNNKLVAITNNAIEYQRVLSHLKKDKLEYIKMQLMGILGKLIMMVFHEDTYLAIRSHLRNLRF